MKVKLLPLARRELEDAADWYDEQAIGLGQEFLDEVDGALARIVSYPESCPEIEPGLRRCLLARFPYCLIYETAGETLVVAVVAHLRREPRYWADR